MRIPYVIDNQQYRLADVLNEVLTEHSGRSLDVANAYFTVTGYGLVRERLSTVGSFRLLLGAEPIQGEQVGLRPDAARVRGRLNSEGNRLESQYPCAFLGSTILPSLAYSGGRLGWGEDRSVSRR